jgi:hypothetical protein
MPRLSIHEHLLLLLLFVVHVLGMLLLQLHHLRWRGLLLLHARCPHHHRVTSSCHGSHRKRVIRHLSITLAPAGYCGHHTWHWLLWQQHQTPWVAGPGWCCCCTRSTSLQWTLPHHQLLLLPHLICLVQLLIQALLLDALPLLRMQQHLLRTCNCLCILLLLYHNQPWRVQCSASCRTLAVICKLLHAGCA